MKNPIIAQTARDYDMDYHTVERLYNLYGGTNEFYERLEEELKQRRNR